MANKKLKLVELRTQATEAMGVDPGMDIELDDGSVLTVPHPLLLSGAVQEEVEANRTSTVASAKAVLGEGEYARLISGGGSPNDVMLAWSLMSKEMKDKLPDGTPTLPSTS